jgi:hypothetical protein
MCRWKLGQVVLCTVVCKMHATQLLTALCSPNVQQTDFVCVGVVNNNCQRGNVKSTLGSTLSIDVLLKFYVRFTCLGYHFERRTFLLPSI